MVIDDVTPQLQEEANRVDVEAKHASIRLKNRRPMQYFLEMGLTALTQKRLDTNQPLQPSPKWTFEGKKLSEIYDETYEP